MFSLMRNIGSSIGISVVVTLLSRGTQAAHAGLVETITPIRDAVRPEALPQAWDWTTTAGAAALNAEVTRQASLIAYLADFRLMMWITLLAVPLVMVLAAPKRGPAPAGAAHLD
jgi:DHA2 family multidrug resistance protein